MKPKEAVREIVEAELAEARRCAQTYDEMNLAAGNRGPQLDSSVLILVGLTIS